MGYIIERAVNQIRLLCDNIEANSRPAANSEQPLVGPPVKTEERPAALARPATLAEIESVLKESFRRAYAQSETLHEFMLLDQLMRQILQGLGTLDQGPIASSHTKVEFVTDVVSTNTSSLKQ